MYAIGSTEILNALIAAARRGVRVRLATQTNRKNMNEKFPDISVRRLPTLINTLMHNKFSVIDGYLSLRELLPKGAKEPVTVCVTGSFNWVNYLDSCDDIFITSAPRICKSLEQEFHYIWNNCAFIKH
ncbi:uncharacterized protein [Drosophila kikkawai]|uniref:Mitochondrial cardiolipin hydrolase n=1 Tax=Drosophila kikkawai TaxID=30033 RepID=A0ABM4GLN3_DROKI